MNLTTTEILEALVNGVHPKTQEQLQGTDASTLFDDPSIIRALIQACKAVGQSKKMPPRKKGAPWTTSDEQLLCKLFKEGKMVSQISETLERTKGAIVGRLIKEELIPSDAYLFNKKDFNKDIRWGGKGER